MTISINSVPQANEYLAKPAIIRNGTETDFRHLDIVDSSVVQKLFLLLRNAFASITRSEYRTIRAKVLNDQGEVQAVQNVKVRSADRSLLAREPLALALRISKTAQLNHVAIQIPALVTLRERVSAIPTPPGSTLDKLQLLSPVDKAYLNSRTKEMRVLSGNRAIRVLTPEQVGQFQQAVATATNTAIQPVVAFLDANYPEKPATVSNSLSCDESLSSSSSESDSDSYHSMEEQASIVDELAQRVLQLAEGSTSAEKKKNYATYRDEVVSKIREVDLSGGDAEPLLSAMEAMRKVQSARRAHVGAKAIAAQMSDLRAKVAG